MCFHVSLPCSRPPSPSIVPSRNSRRKEALTSVRPDSLPLPLTGRVALLGIAHRTIRASRSHISAIRRPRKAFPTTLKTLGDRLQVARFEKGLLQSEIAKQMQIPTTLVKRWEENSEMPTRDQGPKIACLLNLTGTANSNNPTAE
jgi:ribosome-binding protein aMBF1 (putative translation factor)